VSTTSKVPVTPGSQTAGQDLASVMAALRRRGSAMPPSLAAVVARAVARALHDAHKRATPHDGSGGVVHLEVTPANVMLLKAGGVQFFASGGSEAARAPGYRSPEQVRATATDQRSEIFSLGIVLWEMVAGERLFAGETESEMLQNVLTQPITEPSRRRDGIPAQLDAIVARALEREPANRHESAEALANELDRVLVEIPVADDAIAKLLDELSQPEPAPKRESAADPLPAAPASGVPERPLSIRGSGGSRAYRRLPPPQPPRLPLPTLIGIFLTVVAVVVTVGRAVIRHHPAGDQSSSARSVSTNR
jgi:serine/threonine protein kinase